MVKIKLDFRNVKYFLEIHEILKSTFEFSEYYGQNLSALWDCLYEFCPLDAKVEIYGIEYLNDKFDGYGEKIKQIFDDLLKEEGSENIKFVIHS